MNRTHSLKKVSLKKKGDSPSVKRKKETVSEVLRSWGLPAHMIKKGKTSLRYRDPLERGILWYWFSLWVRNRDKDLPCISCGVFKDDYQGGHFIPAGSMSCDFMVFNERNVHAECGNCNHKDKRKLKYGIELNKRLGAGTKEDLERLYEEYKFGTSYKNWSRQEYIEKITRYKALLSEMGDN